VVFAQKISFERDLFICIEISAMNSRIHLPSE
jgi:hypothetical protein